MCVWVVEPVLGSMKTKEGSAVQWVIFFFFLRNPRKQQLWIEVDRGPLVSIPNTTIANEM